MSARSISVTFNNRSGQGFAVVNVVTTGFMPETHDRVLEVAVVHVSETGQFENEWSTLVNPQRDPGAIHLHGIPSRDLLDAPTFADVAGLLLNSFEGRTVVIHNSSFGMRFIHHELNRAGYDVLDRPEALCTMKWAGKLVGPAKLEQYCSALDIPLDHKHHALPAARATAQLLQYLLHNGRSHSEWQKDIEIAQIFTWPSSGAGWKRPCLKDRSAQLVEASSWMSAVLDSTWIAGSPENEAAYMLALEPALLDRYISVTEGDHLIVVAQQSGVSRERIIDLHVDYLTEMSKMALEDGVVSREEREGLERAAQALGLQLSAVDSSLARAIEFSNSAKHVGASAPFLAPGDRVVFTGAMRKDRDAWIDLIVEAGLASGGITKSTRLLVCADPDSMSGKACKARGYGVPVVDEEAFERMFAEYCSKPLTV